MAPFDFALEQAKLLEYQNRPTEEQRGPTGQYELPEPVGWADRLRDMMKDAETEDIGLTYEEVESYRDIIPGAEQLRWHQENDRQISEPFVSFGEDDAPFVIYAPYVLPAIWGDELAGKIIEDLKSSAELFIKHYEPIPPKNNDKRFKDAYMEDLKIATQLGYPCGVLHIALRREDGHPEMVPMSTNEVLDGRHKFAAIDKFMRDITPMKQSIGMATSVLAPYTYRAANEVATHWAEKSAFKAISHTTREISTTTVLNVNLFSAPHADNGDYKKKLAMLHVWGDYDREKGGQLSIPIIAKSFVMYPDSLLWMRSGDLVHFVRRPVSGGQRLSMVHVMQEDMKDFAATKLPPTPQEKRDQYAAARPDDEETACPFCGIAWKGGRKSIDTHLTALIKKGGDAKHEVKAAEEWKRKTSAELKSRGLARRAEAATKWKEIVAAEEGEEVDDDQGSKATTKRKDVEVTEGGKEVDDDREPKAKRRRVVKAQASDKYERYAAPLFER